MHNQWEITPKAMLICIVRRRRESAVHLYHTAVQKLLLIKNRNQHDACALLPGNTRTRIFRILYFCFLHETIPDKYFPAFEKWRHLLDTTLYLYKFQIVQAVSKAKKLILSLVFSLTRTTLQRDKMMVCRNFRMLEILN